MENGGFKVGLNEYARSVVANKATLAGYAGGAFSVGLIALSNLVPEAGRLEEFISNSAAATMALVAAEFLPLVAAQVLLVKTVAGLDTLDVYRESRKRLEEMGSERALGGLKRYYRNAEYCQRAGVQLALKEKGIRLEEILED